MVGIVPGPSEPPLHMNSYLIFVACDIPACRKVLGFYGHMSRAGCSKCTKIFVFNGNKIDFGGFNECPLRTTGIRLLLLSDKQMQLLETELRENMDHGSHHLWSFPILTQSGATSLTQCTTSSWVQQNMS